MTYKTILFDFDGTLTPSLELWLQAFHHALAQYGRKLPDDTIIHRIFYRPYGTVIQEFDLPSAPEFERHVYEGLTLASGMPRLFPGVRQVLEYCHSQKLPMGVVTSSPKPPVVKALKLTGIAQYFEVIVTGDDITHFKPHPEPVLKALAQMGRSAAGTLFVGDYTADILAGHAAGTEAALFLPELHTRFYDFAALHATQPDFVFSAYSELLTHLQALA